ncbi:MAG TPA: YhbY family RNA-binding protein [Burkholderiaceae bacterium]|nr:YhbY family RNA-binding protein [Burkholderiaceae bacterium]
MAKLDITPHERSALRAAAHPLRPVVLIGAQGLSESVLKEIDLNLNAHELIKVRVAGEDRETREALLASVCEKLACAPVHHLGRTLILYRPRPKEDTGLETRAVRKPSEPYTPKKLAAEGLKRTGRNRTVRIAAPAPATPAKTRGRAAQDADTAHNIPRRSRGSALTLRAGMRRNTRKGQR